MFGMEKDKKKKGRMADYVYDLEKDLKDGAKMKQIKEKTDERVLLIKNQLRKGEDSKQFEEARNLLDAYLAMQKVIQRLNRK